MTENQTDKKPLRRRVPGDDDIPLVNRALPGDTEAFEDLVRRHECRVFRTAQSHRPRDHAGTHR